MTPSPRPWLMRIVRQPLTDNVYFIQIDDADGNKVCAFSTHASVGGRGVEQGIVDAKLIVALVNSPAAAAFEGEARHAAPTEIPETEPAPAGDSPRLL